MGLLCCNVGVAKIQKWESMLPPGSSKQQMCEATHASGNDDYCHSFYQKYYIYLPAYKTEIIVNPKYYNGQIAYFVFENVSKRMKCKLISGCKHGDGTLKKIAYTEEEAYAYADPNLYAEFIKKKKQSKAKSSTQSRSLSTDDKISQSKQICKDLGFKVNTEKFADCALKMMSMQFEATNKVASSGGTTQEIIVKHKNDYDIWDALLDTSALLRNNNTSNSSSSSGTNCKVYQRDWGADMVCR